MGDGVSNLFWVDPWLDGQPLFRVFVKLYELAENKLKTVLYELAENKLKIVAHMFARGWGVNGEAWKRRRRLFAWEEDLLGECIVRLTVVTLQVARMDRWNWSLHASNCYTVSSAYSYLTKTDFDRQQSNNNNFMWLKVVPLKVFIFAWRLFLNRIPTRDKLFERRILLIYEQCCVANCGINEDRDHLFLNCDILVPFGSTLWDVSASQKLFMALFKIIISSSEGFVASQEN